MGFASNFNQKSVEWDIDTSKFEYVKLKELEAGSDNVYPLKGFFISKDHGYGEGAVLITDEVCVNIPERYVQTLRNMFDNDGWVQQIKAGGAGFYYETFYTDKYKREGYRITFVDLDKSES